MRRALGSLTATLLALAVVPAAHAATDPVDAAGSPLDLISAKLTQDGSHLVLAIHTRGDWASKALTSRRGRSLCLILAQGPRRFVCASATSGGRPALTSTQAGGVTSALSAEIKRADLRSFTARFSTSAIGLKPGAFRWVVTSTWTDPAQCDPGAPACGDRLPNTGFVSATLLPPTPTGCKAHAPWSVSNASRSRRVVALTFDDGPSSYTRRVLDILERNEVRATFFVIGQQVAGDVKDLRRALSEGHALANHSWNHANLSGGGAGQLSSTQAAVRRATGYTPCVFRPPGGATSSLLVSQARAQGLATVLWDVDPQDWRRPGSGAIYSNIVGNARPGSIILMHDGGGPRDQTVAALPRIISTLRGRGYRFATVPEILGFRSVFG